MSRLTHVDLSAIRRLLAAGIRHAEIARRLNLAVGTISRIASDRKLRRRKLGLVADADLPDDEDHAPPEYVATNLSRCPDCGGMVYQWPCLACRLSSPTLRVGQADEKSSRGRKGEAPAEPRCEVRERGREGEGETPSWARVSRPRPLSDLRSPGAARSETCAEQLAPAEPPAGPTGRPAPAQAAGLGHECETDAQSSPTLRVGQADE